MALTDSVFDLLGKVNNLDDPEPVLNRKAAIFGTVISFMILSNLCAAFRLWIRFHVTRTPGWDDFFLVLAMLANIVCGIGICVSVNQGLGQHFVLLGYVGMSEFIHAFYVANGAYPLSTTLVKLAILLQYLRVFNPKQQKLCRFTIACIVLVSCWGVANVFLTWVPCIPVSAYWNWLPSHDDETIRYGYGSHNPRVFVATYMSAATTNMALDVVILIIPIPLWLNAGMQWRSRVGLLCLFVLGTIANLCSIIRLVDLVKTRAATYPTLDPSWYGATPVVFSFLEVSIASMCASLPVFWPVLQQNIGKIFVTREVNVTSETRQSSGVGFEESELFAMGSFPDSKGYINDSFTRLRIDPLHEGHLHKATVEVGTRQHFEREGSADERVLNRLHVGLEHKESREVLLKL